MNKKRIASVNTKESYSIVWPITYAFYAVMLTLMLIVFLLDPVKTDNKSSRSRGNMHGF